jgi:hypothetical protein
LLVKLNQNGLQYALNDNQPQRAASGTALSESLWCTWLPDRAVHGPIYDAIGIVIQSYDELPEDIRELCGKHRGLRTGRIEILRELYSAMGKLRNGTLPSRDELDALTDARNTIRDMEDGFWAVADLEKLEAHMASHLTDLGDRLEEGLKALRIKEWGDSARIWAHVVADDNGLPLRPGEKKFFDR